MFHIAATIFVVFVVLLLTAVVFAVWVIVSIIKTLARLASPSRRPPTLSATICGNHLCRASLPAAAQFCRRCGVPRVGAKILTRRSQISNLKSSTSKLQIPMAQSP